jgi:hypothetical protein
MNMLKIKYMKSIHLTAAVFAASLAWLASCVDLDVLPTTIIKAEDIYSNNGMKAYMAGMYNHLPMEEFHYYNGYYTTSVANVNHVNPLWSNTGESTGGIGQPTGGYWGDGFKIIRQANTLIADLPKYPALGAQANEWIAEAKFIRAYVYFQLAKRYGGLPKVFEAQTLDPNDVSKLWVARESHADTYDFILKDLDDAIAGLPAKSDAGRANRYAAAALKSRVALHAATTARYGSMKFTDWEVDGVLLQGIPASRANGYFKQAWDAAKLVESGGYELHRANSDKTANYAEVWEKADGNKESIWLRKYDQAMWVHQWDAWMAPPRMRSGTGQSGGAFNPTLDWVELFDGLPLDAQGHFSAFDASGHYIVYDNCQQLWSGAEPRLRANLLIPGNQYKGGVKLDLRAGVFDKRYDPDVDKFKKFSVDNGFDNGNYRSQWNKVDYPANPFADGVIINSTSDPRAQTDLYEVDGLRLFKNGLDGPKMSNASGTSTQTGFHGRKYLDINDDGKNTSESGGYTQAWIEIRYAEMLLNRAEAAIELAQGGEAADGGADMLQDAFDCINSIRDRAGAIPLGSAAELSAAPAYTNWNTPGPKGQGGFVEAPNRALQIVRVERYKELAFENKIYWDLKRWFTFDTQIRNYYRRGLYAFMFSRGATVDQTNGGVPDGKYIYDAKVSEALTSSATFGVNSYYEGIPSGELKNNPRLQKNRDQ